MFNTRIHNLIKEYIISQVSQSTLIRVFADNECPPNKYLIPKDPSIEEVYEECYNSLPLDAQKKDEILIDILNEIIYKVRIGQFDAYYSPNIQLTYRELKLSLEEFGYYIEDYKFLKKNIITNVTSNSDIIIKLRKDLINKIEILDVTEIIGKSKELLESTFKLICEKNKISYDKKDEFNTLMNKAIKSLNLLENSITDFEKTLKYFKEILNTTCVKINEIRNIHGSGHGKEINFIPIDKDSAILISNLALSISQFLETNSNK